MDKNFFDSEEKARMFDEIAAHYYERNFGTFSKTDMDLLMFRFYMDRLREKAKDKDGGIDYNRCSDYKISKDLGITQQRIRNLKVKKELIYPTRQDGDWKKEFASLTVNAQYDKQSSKFSLQIPDPNLFLEIQNFLQENGGYIEKQLSSDLLVIRAEFFIDLIISISDEKSRKEIIRQLKKSIRESGSDERKLNEDSIGKSLLGDAISLIGLTEHLSVLGMPLNEFGRAIRFISEKISEK